MTMRRTTLGLLVALVAFGVTIAPASAGGWNQPYDEYFEKESFSVSGDYTPIGGLTNCEDGETGFVLWYAPGSAQDHLWTLSGLGPLEYTSTPVSVNGDYVPLAGDFDGDGCDDIFWYAPGAAADYVWWGQSDGSFTSSSTSVNGHYEPFVGNFTDNSTDDIFWYAPGSGSEYVWDGQPGGSFDSHLAPSVNGQYRPASVYGTILWHAPGAAPDYLWSYAVGSDPDSQQVAINGTYVPLAAPEAILLYAPGPAPDYAMVDVAPFETISATINGHYTTGVRSPAMSDFMFLWHAPGAATDHLWSVDT